MIRSMFRSDITRAAAGQLARDLNCKPEDFCECRNTVTRAALLEGRRRFTDKPEFFRTATFGCGAVISAAEQILPFAESLSACDGLSLFDGRGIATINASIIPYGHYIGIINQYYLPQTPCRPLDRQGYRLELFEENAIESQLYPYYKEFTNALMYSSAGERRDVLAVCAVSGQIVLGMAGASSDSDMFWQIGIDILPQFRGKGLGAILVSALASEVFRRGAVPYYGTWPGNIASHKTAVKSGFRPAWTEMFSTLIPGVASQEYQ